MKRKMVVGLMAGVMALQLAGCAGNRADQMTKPEMAYEETDDDSAQATDDLEEENESMAEEQDVQEASEQESGEETAMPTSDEREEETEGEQETKGEQETNQEEAEDVEKEQTEAADEKGESESEVEGDEISPEFKQQVDDLEAFYNEYCDFMDKYANASDPADLANMMTDYADFLAKYAICQKQLEEMNENQEQMTQAELNYFLDAYARIMKRMANVAYTVG